MGPELMTLARRSHSCMQGRVRRPVTSPALPNECTANGSWHRLWTSWWPHLPRMYVLMGRYRSLTRFVGLEKTGATRMARHSDRELVASATGQAPKLFELTVNYPFQSSNPPSMLGLDAQKNVLERRIFFCCFYLFCGVPERKHHGEPGETAKVKRGVRCVELEISSKNSTATPPQK